MKANRFILAALAAIFIIALPAAAQTNVIGTITDPTGVPYNTGYIRFDLIPSGGPVPCVGTPCTSINGHYGNVYLDGNGHFQMNLWANGLITPASTKWQITVSEPGNPAPWCFGPQSFTTALTIPNQATYDISSQLSALAPQLCRNSASPGGNCPPNSVDTGVLTEHPLGTCYDSADWKWDDTLWNNTQGDGSNSLSLTNTLAFTQGTGNHQTDTSQSWAIGDSNTHTCDANTIGTSNCFDFFDIGRLNTITDTGTSSNAEFLFEFGESQTITATGGASAADLLLMNDGNTAQSLLTGHIDHIVMIGKTNTAQSTGASSVTSSLFVTGESNQGLSSAGGNVEDNMIAGENNTIQSAQAGALVGFGIVGGYNNTMKSAGAAVQVNYGVEFGHLNKIGPSGNGATGTMTDFALIGHSITLENCTDCFAFGKNIDGTNSNTVYLGMSATPAVKISNNAGSHDNFTLSPLAFASLPACAAGTEGSLMPVTDSTTNTWGATITGGSTNHVLAYCDGTNWTVAAK